MAQQAVSQGYLLQDREQSGMAEAFRVLVATIQDFRTEAAKPAQTVLFTGVLAGQGTAMTAANTAVSLAHAGKRVIIVECDLRFPVLHEIFGLVNRGVIQILQEKVPLSKMLQDTKIPSLKVLACGQTSGKPMDTLSDPAMLDLLDELKTLADVVIINSSPVTFQNNGVVSYACVLAGKGDGVLLVIDSRTVLVKTVRKVLGLLSGARAKLIGCAVNDVQHDADLICPVSGN